ncbi:MAG: U32 family peptidase [Bacteroidales bacterium]|nr:U32 family peptidase [Bacteroidales bacterium]
MSEKQLELLAPAKNLEQGKAAINHGADAVYVGAPQFGARAAVGNSIGDIAALVEYAHLFHSKVFTTVNTLLFDDELEGAEKMVWQLYNAGVDALIIQDVGLLELHLPPIALHASTQMHNVSIEQLQFLENVGFRRAILARETSLEQMAAMRAATTIELEAFVQGALCVCYSGQCYMSQYLNGRSGNRGCCTQPCRSSYDLVNEKGRLLQRGHLLSLRDFSAAQHLENMIDAGITSFKIEGRLKDISYVKNLTAYYRQLLDQLMERRDDCRAASAGHTTLFFKPDLERTFNRGFTDYFLVKRQPMASPATQKSMGKRFAAAQKCHGETLEISASETPTAGDGLCYFDNEGNLNGFLVNRAESLNTRNTTPKDTQRYRIVANKAVDIAVGTTLWRNNDYAFEKQLQGDSAERKIIVNMTLGETATGLSLLLSDEEGLTVTAETECAKEPARDATRAEETLRRQLSKMGGTPFTINHLDITISKLLFVPAAILNELRRRGVEMLIQKRIQHYRPADCATPPNDAPHYQRVHYYNANVVNHAAQRFYERHGATVQEWGLEHTGDYAGKALMTSKYCLRYELGQCLCHKCNKAVSDDYAGTLFLVNNGKRFRLEFNCQRCEMMIYAD